MWKRFSVFIRILKKTSWERLSNAVLLLCSYYYSRLSGKSNVWAFPIALSVEPTTACNLQCPQCPSGLRSFNRPTGNLKLDEFIKWIRPLQSKIWMMSFYFQGEPFIHPKICEAIRYAHSAGIYTMSSTNAHFLDDQQSLEIVRSGLDQLIISIDGSDQDVYEQYRKGGRLEQVLKGTENLLKARQSLKAKNPWIIWQFIVFRTNEHQMNDVRQMAKQSGVDEILFKTAQIYENSSSADLIPEHSLYSRYTKDRKGKMQIKNKLLNHCWRLWRAPVITWDGRVVPCCFDKDASHQMGLLESSTFDEIWNGDDYHRFRNKLLQSRKSIGICQNCSEGTKIWI